MHQLIDEPTNVRGEGMSCIDLIKTDQPNIFVESGVHPSLDEHCQHKIVCGKLNISIPPPPPYHRTIWEYSMSNDRAMIDTIASIDWLSKFSEMGPEEMTTAFTNEIYSIVSAYIPNKIIKFNGKDPP